MRWIGCSYPQGAEDLVCSGGLAEPLLEHVERAGVGLVAVGLAGVGDDDRPVLQIGCHTRGGLDGDVGRDTGENDGINACDVENCLERGSVKPAGRLSPDDCFIRSGGDIVDNLDGVSALQQGRIFDERTKQRGIGPNSGQARLVSDQGVDNLCLGTAETVEQPRLDPDDSVSSARFRKSRLKGVSTCPATPLTICTTKSAVRAGSILSTRCLLTLRAVGKDSRSVLLPIRISGNLGARFQ